MRALLPLLLLSSCTREPGEREVACADIDPRIPTVAHIEWTSQEKATSRVSLIDGSGDVLQTTAWSTVETREHRVHMVGLEPGSTARLRPEVQNSQGEIRTLEALELEVPSLPPSFPGMTAESNGEHGSGYVLTHVLSSEESMVLIVDRDGNPVWYTMPRSTDRILSVSLSLDGKSIWFAQHPTDYIETGGVVFQIALDGSFYRQHDLERVHSGAAEVPEGGFGYLRKGDMEYQDGVLLWDEIWEHDVDGQERQVFSLLDHFEPEELCSHWALTVVESQDDTAHFDWTHANSLVLSEDGSAWYLGVRHFDALLKIDRESGDLLWTLGGPYSDFQATEPGTELSHPHLSQVEEGRALFFDNGSHHSPPGSRLVQLVFDDQAMEVSMESELRAPDGSYIPELGDAIRTPEGNLMGSWTSLGLVEEYNADLEPVWTLGLDLGFYTGRIVLLDSLQP